MVWKSRVLFLFVLVLLFLVKPSTQLTGRNRPTDFSVTLKEQRLMYGSESPIPLADAQYLLQRRIENFRTFVDEFGIERRYRPGIVLVKAQSDSRPMVHRVPNGMELEAKERLTRQPEVLFAELDVVLSRQSVPNDPGFAEQWHHAKIGSTNAWRLGYGDKSVVLAIVDTPFQMDHPDLAAHSVPGWDIINEMPISMVSTGYYHSTIGAGMAAAVIDNELGVSGVVNCNLMPIDIGDEPTVSDMHRAISWAADNGVRVVNLSWDGAFSAVLDDAGAYLKEKAGGMLFMSGINQRQFLNYPNHPNIYAVSMTDANDEARSAFGDHIDFAAPGFEIYSTTTNSTYEIDSGTSYSAPLMAGVAAWIMSINPELEPDAIEALLQAGVVDLGTPGWDQEYGWGRVDFSKIAEGTFASLHRIRISGSPPAISVKMQPEAQYQLFRTESLESPNWKLISSPILITNLNTLWLSDPDPPSKMAFYQLEISMPP